jgi:hypothetical protein
MLSQMKFNFSLIIFLVVTFAACKKEDDNNLTHNNAADIAEQENIDTTLRMNQLQIIASHNSYRLKTYGPLFDAVLGLSSLLPPEYDPNDWDYTHLPFNQQFDQYNVRGLEIDIYYDPAGGQFYNQKGKSILLGEPDASNVPELLQPGFKVLHIPDVDYMTHYYTFKSALQAVKNWSDAHPNHVPIFINIEAKDETIKDVVTVLDFTPAIPYTSAAADELDAEIKSVFGNDLENVISPDEVRGTYTTLREAVLAGNWLRLKEARGKVVFIMQGGLVNYYEQGHASLQGRACFTYANPSSDEAAFVILNSAVSDETQITQRVTEGFIVRTRSDSSPNAARNGDYTGMNAAFRGGAQIISTDYYKPDEHAGQTGWTNYQVKFPNGELARINPVSAAEHQNLGRIKELP